MLKPPNKQLTSLTLQQTWWNSMPGFYQTEPLGCPGQEVDGLVIGSVGDFTPIYEPFISMWITNPMAPFTIGSIHDILAGTSFRNPWSNVHHFQVMCLRFQVCQRCATLLRCAGRGATPHYGTSPAETTVGAPGETPWCSLKVFFLAMILDSLKGDLIKVVLTSMVKQTSNHQFLGRCFICRSDEARFEEQWLISNHWTSSFLLLGESWRY